MRAALVALVMVLAGCAAAPPAATTCERVYDPLFDPAGPRREVAHEAFAMPARSVEPGCRVFGEARAFRAAWLAGDGSEAPREVDFGAWRVVALRAPEGACRGLEVREVYGLPSATVVSTRLVAGSGGAGCPEGRAVWGILVPRDGASVLHAHDEREAG